MIVLVTVPNVSAVCVFLLLCYCFALFCGGSTALSQVQLTADSREQLLFLPGNTAVSVSQVQLMAGSQEQLLFLPVTLLCLCPRCS